MAPPEVDIVARGLANLRLQVDALEVVVKSTSLPALIVSSVIKLVGDERVRSLEKRIEQLEQTRDTRHP